jgi:hypothetical protein
MRFEQRDLKPYAEPISSADLKVGDIYFAVNYVDDEMLLPTMETLVFIGRDLEPKDSGLVYFQDLASYRRGVRYSTAGKHDHARFFAGSENEVGHIFTYERALEQLMACSLRRRKDEPRS